MKITKPKKSPLEVIRDQNLLLKKFGEKGLMVYRLIGSDTTVGELMDITGLSEKELTDIIEFMEENRMIDIIGEKPESPSPETEGMGGVPSESVSKEEGLSEETVGQTPEPVGEVVPSQPEETEEEGVVQPPEIVPPQIPETTEEMERVEAEQTSETKHEEVPEVPSPPLPGEIKTEEIELPEESTEMEKEGSSEEVPEGLSEVERKIYERFGEVGVKVYNLIDGERTAEEILKETGISELKLIEILEFLDENGIIKLEKPSEHRPRLDLLEPITARAEEEFQIDETEVQTETVEKIPIDLPVKTRLGFLDRVKLIFGLRRKFGNKGKKIYEMIDGKNNVIDLAVKNKVSIYFVDAIMEYLSEKKAAKFRTLKRDEILARYGEEGLTIYKKYGRDGVYIYELIGRIPSFKELVAVSGMNPERVIDIFIYIHKVLNIDLPLSKEMLYKEIGL